MIWKIARKEFLLNLMTFKFAVATTVCGVLAATFAPMLARDYQQRIQKYDENVAQIEATFREVKVYKNITPTVFRRPAVLSVFSEGLERSLADSAHVALDTVPELKAATTQGNPYQAVFPVLDASLIFRIVVSVLALLVAYDAVSGERERGMLKLMLSGSTPRYQVLLSKLLAGLLVLVVPVTATFAIVLVILMAFPTVDLTGAEWGRVVLMYLASLLFVAAMYNLGLLFSCLTKKSAVSLVLALFLWIFFAVIVPNGSAYLATELEPLEPQETIEGQLASCKKEYEREMIALLSMESGGGSQSDAEDAFGGWYSRMLYRDGIACRCRRWPKEYALKTQYAETCWQVRRRRIDQLYGQRRLADRLSRLSPICLYGSMMSNLAGTDPAAFRRFIDDVRTYRVQLIEYIRSKTDGFSSPSFFTTCTEAEAIEYERLCEESDRNLSPEEADRQRQAFRDWFKKKLAETPSLDLSDRPQFASAAGALGSVQETVFDGALLAGINAVFFALSFAAFMKYDVR